MGESPLEEIIDVAVIDRVDGARNREVGRNGVTEVLSGSRRRGEDFLGRVSQTAKCLPN